MYEQSFETEFIADDKGLVFDTDFEVNDEVFDTDFISEDEVFDTSFDAEEQVFDTVFEPDEPVFDTEFEAEVSGDMGYTFTTDETLIWKDGVLSVNRATEVEKDNTLPITAAAVHTTVGNIEILLGTI